MPENRTQNDMIFFLGAGASIEAGVPDTIKFIYGKGEKDKIQGFIEYLDENKIYPELKIFETILKTLCEKNHSSKIDIELVLGTINALNRKKDFELVYFYEQNTFKFNSEEEMILNNLEIQLKYFIRKKVVVTKKTIDYLAPLIYFKPINIFSVNYDTCIEMLCTKHRLTYTDGFDLYWNPELFNSDKFDIKLFKLHGSIMWYSTDHGNFVKLLSKNVDCANEISLLTEEMAQPFIMYPIGGKLEYIEPIGYLTKELQKNLKKTELCIVVGYSFRDEHIKRIFLDSAKENENLIIILISPNAGSIFNDKLRYRDEEKSIQSPLFDRVICFNYQFGSVLKDNYLLRIKNKIPHIFKMYPKAINESKNLGITDKFKVVIHDALEVGHVYLLENIFEIELGISPPDTWGEFNRQEQFSISYTLAIFYLMNLDVKGKEYFEFLRNFINDIISKGKIYFDLNIKLNNSERSIDISGESNEYQKILNEIVIIENDSHFYLWSSNDSFLKENISTFNVFIQKQLGLKPNSEYIDLLEPTSVICVNLVNIFNTKLETKYNTSDRIDIRGTTVEVQKKEDIETELKNLSRQIGRFIDFFIKT